MSLQGNIYQLLSGTDLEEVLNDNKDSIVIVMFSDKMCEPCKTIKPHFINLSIKNPDAFFVYIDINNFDHQNKVVVPHAVPKLVFFYNTFELAYVEGAKIDEFLHTFEFLKNKIFTAKQKLEVEKKLNESFSKINTSTISSSDLSKLTNGESEQTTSEKNGIDGAEIKLTPEFTNNESSETKQKLVQLQQLQQIREINKFKQLQQLKQLQAIKTSKEINESKEHDK